MICHHCGEKIEEQQEQVSLWKMGFPAHQIGYAHKCCADDSEKRRSTVNRFMVILYLSIAASCILISEVLK